MCILSRALDRERIHSARALSAKRRFLAPWAWNAEGDGFGLTVDECRILDNLPAAMVKYREEAGVSTKMYEAGFPIGFKATTEEVRATTLSIIPAKRHHNAMRTHPTVELHYDGHG